MGHLLIALGSAFLAAGLLARFGRRFGLPTIPLFMLAGIIFGPSTPGLVLVEKPGELSLLASLGLVLLLFHLGLEFSLDDLIGGGRRLLIAGGIYLTLNIGGGLALGFALGWGSREAVVIAGIVGISSSAIATKLLIELRRLTNPETRLILGVVVVEDIFLALYLAVLQPVLSGDSGGAAVRDVVVAFAFLTVLVGVARLGARAVTWLIDSPEDEILTILFLGLVVLTAGAAEELGVSDAIGAFMAGLIIAETAVKDRVEHLVLPLRDAFAAIFFFAFGLSIDPGDFGTVVWPVAIAVALSFILNLSAGALTAWIAGCDRRAAANIGLTVLARGEFSLILATLALAAGLDSRLGPFTGLYVLVLALAGPILASRSDLVARVLPAALDRRSQARAAAGSA
jgi:CPA2 family monovalent cation:H+ antiporter-2